ncbi:hypothetical protein [Nocardioides marmoribigeumensis]|uniref:LigA protein n=1 Tax=Nocardioides marmoribigeumensis TaxID=433649 RepID=A0ABU2BYJ6_9ACTN|nr:hypothetical protein [Nocardioides marmoribigeumensis]MDR7363471.1 hypothetical protein [Nocardioides marmoribigeumensis]
MGLFRRSAPPSPPDPHLPLTLAQAAKLRDLVRTTFAEAGLEVVVHADHMEDDGGRTLGLWNLAALCNDAPEREWPDLVRRHVTALVDPEDIESLTDDDLLGSVHLRLVERAGFPDPSWHPQAVAVGADLLAILSVDLPETVSTPREDYWDERGGLARWRLTGRANLVAVALSDELEHRRVGTDGGAGAFDVVTGDSFFTGSTALVADHLVRRFSPGTDFSLGLLVGVPFRHQVVWRVLDGTPDSALAMENLFRFTMVGFSDAPGPLSPNLFWVCGDEWRQVTRIADDKAHVEVDEELARALGISGP